MRKHENYGVRGMHRVFMFAALIARVSSYTKQLIPSIGTGRTFTDVYGITYLVQRVMLLSQIVELGWLQQRCSLNLV